MDIQKIADEIAEAIRCSKTSKPSCEVQVDEEGATIECLSGHRSLVRKIISKYFGDPVGPETNITIWEEGSFRACCSIEGTKVKIVITK